MLAGLGVITSALAADSYSEDAVKAAYLYRIAGYVDWPQSIPADAPFIIALLDAPGIARELERLLRGRLIHGRIAHAREFSGARNLGAPQVLYLAAGHADFLRAVVPMAGVQPMLVVTDEEGGLNAGSVLNFLTVDRRVRFEVSLTAAARWGLRISSELLDIAVHVQGSRRQSRSRAANGSGAANGFMGGD